MSKTIRNKGADMDWRKVDQELSAKIASELQMEQEIRETEKLPANISDYLDSSSFEVTNATSHFPHPVYMNEKLT